MSGAEEASPGEELAWPFFEAGPPSPAEGLPIGLIAGGLILDSGEAERTFIFRCQDRYLAYNTLHGMRSLLFVASDEHVRYYREELGRFQRDWGVIAAATGVLPPEDLPEPLYFICDIDRLRIGTGWTLLDQLRRGVLDRRATPRLLLNQISPSSAELVTQLDLLLRDHGGPGGYAVEELQRLGALALRFHNKASYVELVRGHGGEGLPPHVPTAVIPPERFMELKRWQDLVALYREHTGDGEPAALFVKSAQDSSGNVAARLTAEDFDVRAGALRREVEQHILCRNIDWDDRIRELRGEVDLAPTLKPMGLTDARLLRYKRWQSERRVGIQLLVQREVTPPAEPGGRCVSVGFSFQVESPDRITPLTVAAQLYKDADRRSYLGSYFGPELRRDVLTPELTGQMRRLCRLFAEQGWRGPINFDARLDASGRYQLIYDCNPRLTAVFPPLAVRAGLRRQGLPAAQLVSLGYRGEFVWRDLPGRLAELSARGFLYTRERPRGAVVLPNIARRSGFDVALVNVDLPTAREMLASGAFSEGGAGVPSLHA